MRKEYNKLIRDRIPNIIISQGKEFKARKCKDDEEFAIELSKKLIEEATEVKDAITLGESEERIVEELADLEAVIQQIRILHKICDSTVTDKMNKKFFERGGFSDRIFLEWVEEPDDN